MSEIEILRAELEEIKSLLRRPKAHRDCLTEQEAADVVGCSVANLRRLRREGKIRVRYPNFERSYHTADVDEYGRGIAPKQKGNKDVRKN